MSAPTSDMTSAVGIAATYGVPENIAEQVVEALVDDGWARDPR